MDKEEAQRKTTRESMISDVGGSAANNCHLIAPPTLLQNGMMKREMERKQIMTCHSAFNIHLR